MIDYGDSVLVTFVSGEEKQYFGYEKKTVYEYMPQPKEIDGKIFSGWYTDEGGNGSKITEADDVYSYGHTLYAKWVDKTYTVTVTFDAQGGTCSVYQKDYTAGEAYGTLPTPTRTGYDFCGWYTDREGGTKITEGTDAATYREYSLFAHWKIKKFTVTVNKNFGTDKPESHDYEYGTTFSVMAAPTREGYYFKGWKNSGDGKTYFPEDKIVITQDITLTALWDEMRVYITYEGEETENLPPTMVSYSELIESRYSYEKVIPTSILPYIDLGAGSRIFIGYRHKELEGENVFTYHPLDEQTLPFRNMTLVSVIKPQVRASIIFDANGGEDAPGSQPIYYNGVNVIPKKVPTHPQGWTFTHWVDVSPNVSTEGKTEYSPGEVYSHKYETTLRALWTNAYVLRYDSGIPEDDSHPVSNLPEPQLFFPKPNEAPPVLYASDTVPSRQGYTFKWWTYTNLGGDEDATQPGSPIYTAWDNFPDNLPSTGVLTLYACWEKDLHKVTASFYDPYTKKTVSRVVCTGEKYGTSYDSGTATEVELPVAADRDGSYFVGWKLGNRLITGDTVVTDRSDHTLTAEFAELPYTDMGSYSWANRAVSLCKYYGYLTGQSQTEFAPASVVSRGHAVISFYRMAGRPYAGSNRYWDVPGLTEEEEISNSGYAVLLSRSITWADDCGIARGYSEYRFHLDDPATRGQTAVFLYRYAKWLGADVGDTSAGAEFDRAKAWATSGDIRLFTGNDALDSTYWDAGIPRAEFAIVLIRFRNKMKLR